MSAYRFTGEYPANVQVPDGSVRLLQPGEVVDFPADTKPGPVWAPVTAEAAPAADAEPADVAAWLAEHPQDAPAPKK